MSRPEPAVAPLNRMDGEPVFDEPWQAEVLAIADALIERGTVSPDRWSNALGAALADSAESGSADNAETYYRAALSALETVLAAEADLPTDIVDRRRDAWAEAYRNTPHGQPVRLHGDGSDAQSARIASTDPGGHHSA